MEFHLCNKIIEIVDIGLERYARNHDDLEPIQIGKVMQDISALHINLKSLLNEIQFQFAMESQPNRIKIFKLIFY